MAQETGYAEETILRCIRILKYFPQTVTNDTDTEDFLDDLLSDDSREIIAEAASSLIQMGIFTEPGNALRDIGYFKNIVLLDPPNKNTLLSQGYNSSNPVISLRAAIELSLINETDEAFDAAEDFIVLESIPSGVDEQEFYRCKMRSIWILRCRSSSSDISLIADALESSDAAIRFEAVSTLGALATAENSTAISELTSAYSSTNYGDVKYFIRQIFN
ncbi:MAG: hypothetical protein P9L92_06925 [Candidatus Electryonea clarkiae]|nr:hypothetical protein [Candidatus Electryonea clarkiae]